MEVSEGVGPQRLGQTSIVLGQALEYEQALTGVHSTGHVQQVSAYRTALEAVGGRGQPRVIVPGNKTKLGQAKGITCQLRSSSLNETCHVYGQPIGSMSRMICQVKGQFKSLIFDKEQNHAKDDILNIFCLRVELMECCPVIQ